jgi:hypothetical protein
VAFQGLSWAGEKINWKWAGWSREKKKEEEEES